MIDINFFMIQKRYTVHYEDNEACLVEDSASSSPPVYPGMSSAAPPVYSDAISDVILLKGKDSLLTTNFQHFSPWYGIKVL